MEENKSLKLQKIMADAGVASRRRCEELIESGRVTVNGRRAKIGDRADPQRDRIELDGKRIGGGKKRHVYIMLNKPRRVLTAMSDERGRRTVADYTDDVDGRIFPVGRLDYNSEGLLIMTDDGELANAVAHPSHNIKKGYETTVAGPVSERQLRRLGEPFELDGYTTAPANVGVIEQRGTSVVLYIEIGEGRNRQIRRMCEQVGLTVRRLKRVSEGTLELGELAPGEWRYLTRKETDALRGGTKKGDKDDD